MSKPYTVIVILEAKLGKESELESALKAVVEPSRLEKTCLEYRLHKSIENPAQFILFENWESREKHQEHFEKSYIIELGRKLESLLNKPYQAIFASELP
ncbi:putative quinol monooxygenase [Legionella busanensis]|nr:putative quinol monooxygenase [Legionella busanensis]